MVTEIVKLGGSGFYSILLIFLGNWLPTNNYGMVTEIVKLGGSGFYSTTNDLLDRNQSAYRPHHSTETALVLVQNDILKALDRRHGVILILLDMSAAFDTVDHDVLVTRLEQRYGVTGCAIAWIKGALYRIWCGVNRLGDSGVNVV